MRACVTPFSRPALCHTASNKRRIKICLTRGIKLRHLRTLLPTLSLSLSLSTPALNKLSSSSSSSSSPLPFTPPNPYPSLTTKTTSGEVADTSIGRKPHGIEGERGKGRKEREMKPQPLTSFPPVSPARYQVEPTRAQLDNSMFVAPQTNVESPCLSRPGPGDNESAPCRVRRVAQDLVLILPGHVLAHLQHHDKVSGIGKCL